MSRWPRFTALSLALLLACTASGDKKPAADEQPPATPAIPTNPATPATPTAGDTKPATPPPAPDPAAAPTPVPAATSTRTWWCTCYARVTAEGSEPLTACRAERPECEALARSVGAGKRRLVRGSLTHPCQPVVAEHPGDLFGGQDAWHPSKKPGAWLSPGTCHLPGAAAPPPDAGEEEGTEAERPDVYALESIGGLKIGLPAADLLKTVGEPKTRDRVEMEEATADYVQTWDYPDQGLTVYMRSDRRKGPQFVRLIKISGPSKLQSARGFGLGASFDAVAAAYKDLRDPESEADDREYFTAGDLYGGLIFRFEDGKAVEVILGAVAE